MLQLDLSGVWDFWEQVKQIEKRDSVLTSKQQIDRLLRPGASYFNLNPFEVSYFMCIIEYGSHLRCSIVKLISLVLIKF